MYQKYNAGPLTVKAVEQLGVSRRTVYRWLAKGLTLDQLRIRMAQVQAEAAGAELLTVRQAATSLGVGRSTIYRWVYEGELKAIQVFGSFRVVRTWPVRNLNQPQSNQQKER